MNNTNWVDELSGRVRDALGEAETRAREIVSAAEEKASQLIADAEAEAKQIRERASAEGEERLAQVRQALASIEGALGQAGSGPRSEVNPPAEPPVEPMPPVEPEPTPPAEPEPMPPAEPEPAPPEPEIEPPAPAQPDREPPALVNGGGQSGDATAARIVATKMALGGSNRDEIAARLSEEYALDDADALLDSVMAKAGK